MTHVNLCHPGKAPVLVVTSNFLNYNVKKKKKSTDQNLTHFISFTSGPGNLSFPLTSFRGLMGVPEGLHPSRGVCWGQEVGSVIGVL